ncbi:hypothetical protein CHUAL_006058 [Chamberlinius hualienensis]
MFEDSFIRCLMRILIVKDSPPVLRNSLDFVAKFLVGNASKDGNADLQSFKLMKNIWKFIISNCKATSSQIRLHICQLVTNLFNEMDDDADIDVELYSTLKMNLINLLKDKNSTVRTAAVMALSRLQDVTDKKCPVIQGYIFHLVNDPCFEVRKAIINEICLSKVTIPVLITRTRDVTDSIRKATYQIIADKVPIKALSIAKRIDLLKDGLHDDSEKVKTCCMNELLPSWMKQCSNDMLTFLRCFDVIDANEMMKQIFHLLISSIDLEEAVSKFDLLDNQRLIKADIICPESVFYWRSFVEYVSKHPDGLKSGAQDKVLPDFFTLADFIHKQVTESVVDDDLINHMEKTFICQQLIQLCIVYDFSDETERRRGCELCKLILLSPSINEEMIRCTVKLLEKVMPNISVRVETLVEIMSNIREDIALVDVKIDPNQIRQTKLRAAQLKVQININRDELEDLVKKQQFNEAQAKKQQIQELEENLSALTIELQPQMEEICKIKDDPLTLQKCLTILCAMLEAKSLQLPKPTLLTIVDSLVLPSIKNVDGCVRNLAARALGLSCIVDVQLSLSHFYLLLQICQVDVEVVRLTAIKGIFDILVWHGLQIFSSAKEDEWKKEDSKNSSLVTEVPTKTINNLLNIFFEILDSQFTEAHSLVCEGLCKMLMTKRLVSVRTLSRLFVMWYNPTTEENFLLRNILGVFFPTFASIKGNQTLLVEAFIPTLNIFFDAPKSSPLFKINVVDVAEFIIELLRPLRDQKDNQQVGNHHSELAIRISMEILNNSYSCKTTVLIKTLKFITISEDLEVMNKLEELYTEILEIIDDDRLLTLMQTYLVRLRERIRQSLKENSEKSEGHISESSCEVDSNDEVKDLEITEESED